MKAEKEKSKKAGGSGFSNIAAAFATGAAAGIAVGVLISSDRGAKLRDKVRGLVREFGGEWEEREERHNPAQSTNSEQNNNPGPGYTHPDNPM